MSNRKRRRQRRPTRSRPVAPRPPQPPESRAAADPVRHEPQRAPPNDPVLVAAAVAEAIESGVVDAYLGSLGTVLRRRRHQLVRKSEVVAAARFEVGDRVRLGPEVRPKYVRGATATVAGWAHKNVLIRLDHPVGRYPAGTEISVSPLGVHRFGRPR